jgi:hypothetical protein
MNCHVRIAGSDSIARHSLFDSDQSQGAYDENNRSNRADLAENRFITPAFLFAEKLFRSAADGSRKPRAVAVLQQMLRSEQAGKGE